MSQRKHYISSQYSVEKALRRVSAKLPLPFSHIPRALYSFYLFIFRCLIADVNTSVRVLWMSRRWRQQTSQSPAKDRIIKVFSSALSGSIHMEIRAAVSLTTTFCQLWFIYFSITVISEPNSHFLFSHVRPVSAHRPVNHPFTQIHFSLAVFHHSSLSGLFIQPVVILFLAQSSFLFPINMFPLLPWFISIFHPSQFSSSWSGQCHIDLLAAVQ